MSSSSSSDNRDDGRDWNSDDEPPRNYVGEVSQISRCGRLIKTILQPGIDPSTNRPGRFDIVLVKYSLSWVSRDGFKVDVCKEEELSFVVGESGKVGYILHAVVSSMKLGEVCSVKCDGDVDFYHWCMPYSNCKDHTDGKYSKRSRKRLFLPRKPVAKLNCNDLPPIDVVGFEINVQLISHTQILVLTNDLGVRKEILTIGRKGLPSPSTGDVVKYSLKDGEVIERTIPSDNFEAIDYCLQSMLIGEVCKLYTLESVELMDYEKGYEIVTLYSLKTKTQLEARDGCIVDIFKEYDETFTNLVGSFEKPNRYDVITILVVPFDSFDYEYTFRIGHFSVPVFIEEIVSSLTVTDAPVHCNIIVNSKSTKLLRPLILPEGEFFPSTAMNSSFFLKLLSITPAPEITTLTLDQFVAFANRERELGGELYKMGQIADAFYVYEGALDASKFQQAYNSFFPVIGSGVIQAQKSETIQEEDQNVFVSTVSPILANLAACCLKLCKFQDCVKYCNMNLCLSTEASEKILYRKASALLKMDEFETVITMFEEDSTLSPEFVNLKVAALKQREIYKEKSKRQFSKLFN